MVYFKENYECNKCNGLVSIKVKENEWITLKCNCEITIIYFNGKIKKIRKEDTVENAERQRNQGVQD